MQRPNTVRLPRWFCTAVFNSSSVMEGSVALENISKANDLNSTAITIEHINPKRKINRQTIKRHEYLWRIELPKAVSVVAIPPQLRKKVIFITSFVASTWRSLNLLTYSDIFSFIFSPSTFRYPQGGYSAGSSVEHLKVSSASCGDHPLTPWVSQPTTAMCLFCFVQNSFARWILDSFSPDHDVWWPDDVTV